ncbi:MAG TPA: PhoH family protein [Acidimicrobiia bacterium]|nr:PhoH family protein [Acidimicrobiia bacterium]
MPMKKISDISISSAVISIDDNETMSALLGNNDEYLDLIEESFDATILVRGNEITVNSRDKYITRDIVTLINELSAVVMSGARLSRDDIIRAIQMVGQKVSPSEVAGTNVLKGRKSIHPKTEGQRKYVEAIANNTITFGIGPAGTGKSYLAVASAVAALQAKKVQRIILTRPAVEAGEHLGFLPGDLLAKVDPYLRPLYDAIFDIVGTDAFARFQERGVIEVAPLAYMRGRTLNDSFVILDEAQNTSPEQMKMFLTRLGLGSTMVVTGDLTQVDLPSQKVSGLRIVRSILDGVDSVAFCDFDRNDVIRHRVVQEIVDAYDKWDKDHPNPYESDSYKDRAR